MKKQEPTTCESCLSLLTGIIIPKPMFPKEENFGFVLETSDAKILKSIAKQYLLIRFQKILDMLLTKNIIFFNQNYI